MMKKILLVCILIVSSCYNPKEINQVVEISCGQCQFKIQTPKGCDLAVRIDTKVHFIDGVHIDDFGDAHHKETGFCNVIRKATVSGTIENGRLKASSVKLID